MAELLDEKSHLESTTVGVFRTAATIKGGRRFSFSALVVAGDRNGQVAAGYGKANQVPPAIEKAQKAARKSLRRVNLHESTIPHQVIGRYGSSEVILAPASPGTGVVAGAAVRAVLEMAGVQDCLSKCHGSTNKQNIVKATLNGLEQLRTLRHVEELRGVEIGKTEVDDMLARGKVSKAWGPPSEHEREQEQQGGEAAAATAGAEGSPESGGPEKDESSS